MKLRLINKFVKFIPENIKKQLSYELNPYRNFSYGQEGEDLIIDKLLKHKKSGFYIDIGAHHPYRFSNTAIFYKRGWTGINIDAMPGSMVEFNQKRKKDINLELAISDKEENLVLNVFNETALNTLDIEEANKKDGKGNYFVKSKHAITTHKLSDVLDEYLKPEQQIDFISIDTEGFDLKVLKSNNWEKYKPKLILVENLVGKEMEMDFKTEIDLFLIQKGYFRVAKTINTLFFLDPNVE